MSDSRRFARTLDTDIARTLDKNIYEMRKFQVWNKFFFFCFGLTSRSSKIRDKNFNPHLGLVIIY